MSGVLMGSDLNAEKKIFGIRIWNKPKGTQYTTGWHWSRNPASCTTLG